MLASLRVLLVAAASATAQDASPAAVACSVEPRTEDEVAALAVVPGAGTPAVPAADDPVPAAASPAPDLLGGDPADEQTVAAVTGTVQEIVACLSAGDTLAAAALYTEEFIRQEYFVEGGPPLSELLEFTAFITATPVAADVQPSAGDFDVQDANVLPDGRVGAYVVVIDEAGEAEVLVFAVFRQVDDRYLVDEVYGDFGETATPAA